MRSEKLGVLGITLVTLVIGFAFVPAVNARRLPSPNITQIATTDAPSTVEPGQPALVNDLNNQPIVMFTAPNLQADVLFLLPRGTLVTIRIAVKQNNLNWWRIQFNDVYGWVLARIQINESTTDSLVPFSDTTLAQSITSLTSTMSSTSAPIADQFLERGRAYLNRRDYDRAYQDFSQAVQISPSVDTYYWRGITHEVRQETQPAIDDLTKAISFLPNNAVMYVERGYLYQQKKDYPSALFNYQRAIQLSPTFAVAYVGKGSSEAHAGALAAVLNDYSQALALDPYYASALRNRAIVYMAQNQTAQALTDLSQAIKVDPNYAPAYVTRATLYAQNSRFAEANADLDEALVLDPKNADAYATRGNIHFEQGDATDALADMTKALQLTSDTGCKACIYYNIGLVYYSLGDYTKAIDNYSQAIAVDPNYVNAYINRAQAFSAIGKSDLAQADLQKAQEIKQQLGSP